MARDFRYQKRSREDIDKREQQQGGDFEGYLSDEFRTYKVKKGDNLIRIFPATWDEDKDYGFEIPRHYGIDLWVHYSLGPDNASALCLNKMRKEHCPICEARAEAERDGDEDLARELKPGRRVLVWVVDIKDEDKGPLLFAMPWSLDRDIVKVSKDKRTGETFYIDDPDEGYDVSFDTEGEGIKRKYVTPGIARKPSSVDNKDLDYVVDHPLPDTLRWRTPEEMQTLYEGGGSKGSRKKDDDNKPARRRTTRDDEDERPARRSSDDDRSASRSSRDDDERPARRSRDDDDKKSSKDDNDRPARRSRDDDDDRPASRRSSRDAEPEENDRGSRKDREEARTRRSSRDDDGDRPASRDRPKDDDDDRPAARKRTSRDEDEPVPEERAARKRPASRDADEGDDKDRGSSRQDDDKPSGKSRADALRSKFGNR